MQRIALDQVLADGSQTYAEIAASPARLRDTAHLEQVLMDRLKPLPGVVRTHTLIALSTTKETHIVPAALPDAAHA